MSAFSIGATLLDAMVLALLTKEDTYGYQITKDIQEHFAVSESTLYPVLRRLQKNGSLTTYDRPYQGRNRRYYRITVSGRALLDQYRKDWLTYKQQVDFFLDYEIVELLQGINDIGTTILMVTHEHSLVRQFGGRIINIDQGQIVFDEVIGGNLIHES